MASFERSPATPTLHQSLLNSALRIKGTEEALELYRTPFVPNGLTAEPTTFLTVNAAVAENHTNATVLMLPNLQVMAKPRTR